VTAIPKSRDFSDGFMWHSWRDRVGTPGAIEMNSADESGATLSRLSRIAAVAHTRNVGRAPWLGHGTFVLRVRDDPVLRSRFGAPAHRFRRAGRSATPSPGCAARADRGPARSGPGVIGRSSGGRSSSYPKEHQACGLPRAPRSATGLRDHGAGRKPVRVAR
jgi:hypothetical protein